MLDCSRSPAGLGALTVSHNAASGLPATTLVLSDYAVG